MTKRHINERKFPVQHIYEQWYVFCEYWWAAKFVMLEGPYLVIAFRSLFGPYDSSINSTPEGGSLYSRKVAIATLD